MAAQPDQIEEHIQTKRRDLGDNLHELQSRVKQAADWRYQFHQHPGTMLGVAFAGGMALAALTARRSGKVVYVTDDSPGERFHPNRPDPWKNIRWALTAAAASGVRMLLNEALPGFREEHRRAEARSQ